MQVDENGKEIKTILVMTLEKPVEGPETLHWQVPDKIKAYELIGMLEDIKLDLLEHIQEATDEELGE